MSGSDESQKMSSSNTFLRRSISELLNTESDDHCGSQFAVTESSAVVELADQWLRDPELLLKQLTATLNGFCRKYFDHDYAEPSLDSCGDVDPGGSSFTLKAEFTDSLAFAVDCLNLQTMAKAVVSVRDTNPLVPFDPATLRRLLDAVNADDADAFAKAVAAWVQDLRRLAVWVKLQETVSAMPQQQSGPELADELNLVIDIAARTVRRRSILHNSVPAVRLTPANWELFDVLLKAGSNGTTADSIKQTLNISDGTLAQRKNTLKNVLYALGISIPDNRYRLADT